MVHKQQSKSGIIRCIIVDVSHTVVEWCWINSAADADAKLVISGSTVRFRQSTSRLCRSWPYCETRGHFFDSWLLHFGELTMSRTDCLRLGFRLFNDSAYKCLCHHHHHLFISLCLLRFANWFSLKHLIRNDDDDDDVLQGHTASIKDMSWSAAITARTRTSNTVFPNNAYNLSTYQTEGRGKGRASHPLAKFKVR